MDILEKLIESSGFGGDVSLAWQNIVMFFVGGTLITLAVKKNFEPLLLIPIGFGAIMANLPGADMSAYAAPEAGGKWPLLAFVYKNAISKAELLPPIIFMGVGALTDFRPLLSRPITFLLGAAAQIGIFFAALGATYFFGFTIKEAASIGKCLFNGMKRTQK